MPDRLADLPAEFGAVLSEMAPYLLFGFFAAGALAVLISPAWVERHLGGRGMGSVFKAALLGVPMPLCSCGVIPVSASLRRHGASKGATTSFLIATPQTGVDSILVSYSLLGGVFAIFRVFWAFLSGIAGGAIVSLTEGENDGDIANDNSEQCEDACCAPDAGSKLKRIFTYGFGVLPADIGRALLIGLVAAALISVVVPEDYFSDIVPSGILQVLVLMAVGIPIYVCATASIPVASALLLTGVSPGAVFAFLMTGPATNAAAIATIWKVMGRKTAIIYLSTMAVAAMVGGLLLNYIFEVGDISPTGESMWMLPQLIKDASAVVLLGVLGVAVVRPWLAGARKLSPAAKGQVELRVTGMTCHHCTASVRRALLACKGVTDAQIDLESGTALITTTNVDTDRLCLAVDELGYTTEPIEPIEPKETENE